MDVFRFRDSIIGDYSQYITSFLVPRCFKWVAGSLFAQLEECVR